MCSPGRWVGVSDLTDFSLKAWGPDGICATNVPHNLSGTTLSPSTERLPDHRKGYLSVCVWYIFCMYCLAVCLSVSLILSARFEWLTCLSHSLFPLYLFKKKKKKEKGGDWSVFTRLLLWQQKQLPSISTTNYLPSSGILDSLHVLLSPNIFIQYLHKLAYFYTHTFTETERTLWELWLKKGKWIKFVVKVV